MSARLTLLSWAAAGLLLGAASTHLLDRPATSDEIALRVTPKAMTAGQRFSVHVKPPKNLTFDYRYRLMRRENERWVPKADLAAGPGPTAFAPHGERPDNPLLIARQGEVNDELTLPRTLLRGRYRLKKWFLIHDEQAGHFEDHGYDISERAAIQVASWTDFDVRH